MAGNRFIYYDIPLTVRVKTPVDNQMSPRKIKTELKENLMSLSHVGTQGEMSVSSVVERSDAALRVAAEKVLKSMESWISSELGGTSQFPIQMAELEELAKMIRGR